MHEASAGRAKPMYPALRALLPSVPEKCSRCVLDSAGNVLDFLWIVLKILKMISRWSWLRPALLGCDLFAEPIANARHRENKLWALGDWLDFLTQLRHVDMQAVHSFVCLGSPDRLQQHLPCEQLATMRDESLEQVVLGGRELDLSSLDQHLSFCEIYGE